MFAKLEKKKKRSKPNWFCIELCSIVSGHWLSMLALNDACHIVLFLSTDVSVVSHSTFFLIENGNKLQASYDLQAYKAFYSW